MINRYRMLAAAILVLALGIGGAAAAEGPDQVAKRVISGVAEAAKGQRDAPRFLLAVNNAVIPYLDASRMTALTAGRWWRQMTPEQQHEISVQYRTFVIGTFASTIARVAGRPLRMAPYRADPSATSAEIHAEFTAPNGQATPIAFRLERTQTDWKIFDIQLDHTWFIERYQATFATALSRNGNANNLIKLLMEKNRGMGAR